MEMVGVADKADAFVTNLSGGERRRVFLAMTLDPRAPAFLLLDEPLREPGHQVPDRVPETT